MAFDPVFQTLAVLIDRKSVLHLCEYSGMWRNSCWCFYNGNINNIIPNFDVLLTVHLSILISVINQLDAQNFCFAISLFHASTCFEHMCSSSGGQNYITQPLVSSHL